MMYTETVDNELKALREVSARLGADPQLAQASTGNTSIKINDALFIKASGKWLLDAESADFFVGVDVARARHFVGRNEEVPESAVTWGSRRPSIETVMHAVLPHKVVIHVHSVNTIAWAVRKDGPQEVGQRLNGLKWRWIPYTPSGVPLARAVHRVVSSDPETDVLVLGNHGLVVCGPSCPSTERLLRDIELRLCIEGRRSPEPDQYELERAMPDGDWIVAASAEIHALARDWKARRVLAGGTLYPCQAMFLPDTVIPTSLRIEQFRRQNRPGHILFTDAGVLCHKSVTPAQHAMLHGLAEVVRRIDPEAPIRYLTDSEVSRVLNGPRYAGASLNGARGREALSGALLR